MEKLIYRPVLEKIENRLKKNRIIILIGARQTGKTCLMLMLREKIERVLKNISVLFYDCERVEYRDIFSNYEKAYLFLKGQVGDLRKEIYIFLDEFQKVPNIGNTLKLFADHHENIWIVASGSSSLEIRRQIDESLVGRKRVIDVLPLCFEEFLIFTEHNHAQAYKEYLKNPEWGFNMFFIEAFNDYILYGGLPRISSERIIEEKKSELAEIYNSYLEKDIKSFIKEEKIVPFNKLLKILAAQSGNLISVDELAVTVRMKRDEVEEYLTILEQTYIIFFLKPFHINLRKELTKKRKVYFYDTGLRNIILSTFTEVDVRPDGGSLFENAIISEIIKHKGVTDQFYFWQTKQGTEVDLIIKREEKILPVEIKVNLTSMRKLRGLKSFCKHYNVKKGFVITNKKPKKESENIKFIPSSFAVSILAE